MKFLNNHKYKILIFLIIISLVSFLDTLSIYGNGRHINANDSEFGLQQLFKEIREIEKKEISTMKFTDYSDRFQSFLFVSLFLFLLELSILNIKNNPIKKWIKR